MRFLSLGPLACLLACSGPPAPDAALCQDVISRLCLARTCAGVNEALALGNNDCQPTLLQRSGCGEEAFAFSEPSRERVLDCRLSLVKRSTDPGKAPTCEEVGTVVRDCPDVIDFLGGSQP
ncbi:hypothetical protein [Hyalangium rubrum]|uniref:Lipoprotein n=1 Tax=Hyalangium rubrum TaxID=3103134 RepID=A0ABU5H0I7_9BACT|nr:hypothetical protein [Hyalangium sp. s54d21]MDY7226816.1 hypothetical protein [Hyalangium sp. s54d21]